MKLFVNFMKIIVEIWAHLFLWISLKLAKLDDRHYYYFCVLGDLALNYHPTKFGNICKTQYWYEEKYKVEAKNLPPV